MKVINPQTIATEKMECCIKTNVKYLTAKDTQTPIPNTYIVEMEAGGYSTMHKHPEAHNLFIIEGEGVIFDGKNLNHIHTGDVVLIESNELHLIKNNTKNPLRFLVINTANE